MSWWEVNGISLALGSIAGMGTSKSGTTMGVETRINNVLAEVGVFGK